MNKTISINLGGYFFHIDENAYQKLSRYFEAVKRSLAPEGRDEIISDIETRIAELFQERLKNEGQVVSLKEIDEVIAIMGQPEDYKIDEEGNHDNNYSTKSEKPKKLYRDKENNIFGGVAAGLGHYFNIDPLWIRLGIIFIIIAGFGSPIFIYFLLWFIVPEAITTSQKLEMKGEPVNISNIEKKVKEGIDEISGKINDIDGKKITQSARKIGNSISEIFLSVFKILAKILGVFIIFISSLFLISILVTGIIMIFSMTLPDALVFNNFSTPWDFDIPMWIQGLLLISVAGIPSFFILLLGLKLVISNMKSLSNYFKYSLLGIWIISMILAVILGLKKATSVGFDGKKVNKEQIDMTSSDTLFVRMQYNNFYTKSINQKERAKYTHDENNKEVIFSTKVRVHFLKTEESLPFIQIEKKATGSSLLNATSNAEKINYQYDIQNNKIVLDNYFITNFKNKFRNQKVDVYIYLPEGTYVKPDSTLESFDWSNNNYNDKNFFDSDYDENDKIFQVKNNQAKCTNCPTKEDLEEIEELEEIESIHIESDDNEEFTLKINDKQIKIKSEDGKVDIDLKK